MVLKLYGASKSTCTRLVALICKEKEIPYELIPVDLANSAHKAPEYLKFQPFGQIPYIDDDGFILFESRAICRYLIKKYPSQGTANLIPTDLQQEALFEQASSVEVANFNSHASAIAFEKVFKVMRGGQPDLVKVEQQLVSLRTKLDAYETILGKHKYLAGNNLTLADLQHLPYGLTLIGAGYNELFEMRPNVNRWWSDISNRPAWLAVKGGA